MSAKLRIVHIDLGRGWAGGQTQSFALAKGLAARGHDIVFICCVGSEIERRLAELPISTRPLTVGGRLDPQSVIRISAALRACKPDIIHLHDSLSFWLGGVAAHLACSNVPVVVHKRTDHAPGALAALRYGKFANRVIAISKGAAESLLAAGIAPGLITTIYSSVDCDHFKPADGSGFRRESGMLPEALCIGAIGTLAKRKGHDVLLRAGVSILQKVPNTRVVVCGHGDERATLETLAESLGIAQSVNFVNKLDDVRPLLAALDVFVMPSRAEGLGVAALEAMAMGKPVIASRVGGLGEVVENGVTGILVEPDQPEALAEALIHLLADGKLRREFGMNGRRRAETVFSRETMITATEEVYQTLIAERLNR